MSREIHVRNVTAYLLVYTQDGYTIDPYSVRTSVSDDRVTLRLLESGRLIDVTPEEQPPPPEMPSRGASQEEWAEYAISQGYPEADIRDMRRNEIRDLFIPNDEQDEPEEPDTDQGEPEGDDESQNEEEN